MGIKGTARKISGSREHELKTFLGTRGFINGEQGIKSKKIKGSWEHVPPLGGAHVCFRLKHTSGHLNSKGFLRVFLMTRAAKTEKATTSLKTNSMNINHVEYMNINKASRTICNESCQKSQQLQFAEIRKVVSVDPAWNILTCASQNMDEEM